MAESTAEPSGIPGDTLGDALREQARRSPTAAAVFPGTTETLDLPTLDRAADDLARALLADGARPGDTVGLLTGNRAAFLVGFFGILRTGAPVTVLPPPLAGGRATGTEQFDRIVAATDMARLVGHPAHDAQAAHHPDLRVIRPDERGPFSVPLPPVDPEATAVLQFTSGSTGHPRGVQLSHRAVLAGLRAIAESSRLTAADTIVQWVPTYHDMGLFGMLAVLLGGGDAHVFEPWSFLRHPGDFVRHLADCGGTLTTSPNFGYELMLDALAAAPGPPPDLSRWRLAFNGAEPILADTVRRFTEQLAPAGVPPSTMYPVYGMAEVTLAIAFPPPGTPYRSLTVDAAALGATGRVTESPAGKDIVSVGHPVAGLEVRIADDTGTGLPADHLGEIQVRGPSVMSGYFRDPAATRAAFQDGWLRTGDLGFRHDDDLYVAGRRKEMVIVHGHNHFPEDAEAVVRNLPGVYKGRCVAVADTTPGAENMALIVETNLPPDQHNRLTRQVRAALSRELGLAAARVHLVTPRWLTRTTSGKWQRLAAAHRLTPDT